ncbi:MAG: phospholipid carrier-dependent glycosyltransferase [Chloroflexi bacterium]|nr:phospholipid carrier-dependent glycosyltransferase [Chloroflexota bacterium]
MTNEKSQMTNAQSGITRNLFLIAILLVGAYLRFTGLNWDEGQWIHPDEGHMRIITSQIKMPDSLSLYFDTHNSPLNCRNSGHRYSYGTLPLFATRMTAEWLDRSCDEDPNPLSSVAALLLVGPSDDTTCRPGTFTGSRSAQVGRALSALAELGTVFLVYLVGRRLYGGNVGVLAAALYALTAFAIQQAHFFTVDSMACFFTTLTIYFSVRAGQCGSDRSIESWVSFGLAGLATGFAAACKVSAVFVALCVVLAAMWRWLQTRGPKSEISDSYLVSNPHSLTSLFLSLVLAGLLSLVAFRVAQPYAFEGPGFFGVQPSPEWLDRLGQIRVEQSGEVDVPYGRQWTDRAPILFPWKDMVFWGMGVPLGVAAWAAWVVAGLELFGWAGAAQRKYSHLILWGWGSLMFLYLGTGWVKTMRYFYALYPVFVILAAYLLVRLCQISAQRWRRVGFVITSVAIAGTALWAVAFFSIYLRTNTRVAASRWIFANIDAGEGLTLANEHYDWGLPLRVDGNDPFGGMYNGIEMQHYNEDTPEKRTQLYDWLDRSDYVIMASNRLYASIPRLPPRYPLTIEYYRALFAGELGFELVADFTSRPSLWPFQFPDQENPFPLIEAEYVYQTEPIKVPFPPADEAFSVYDHPRVLIFHKTDAYSRELVEKVLGKIDLERVIQGFSPKQATTAPNLLRFDSETWSDQKAGGTWSEMFNRDSLFNRYPALASIAWWVGVTVLGWLAFPLLFVALPRLTDRGYGLARVLGLLFVAYSTWLVASLKILPNTRGTIMRMVILLALVGAGVGWSKKEELRRFLRKQLRMILLIEGLFILLYLAWVGVRLLQPDLWHPSLGGEKPMDFAYLNAVMKSTWFPPYNPWFSGSVINYYYFGFVIVGTLIKLMGTVPAIGYNLAVPLLFALTGVGAFSVAYNLFGTRRRGAVLAGVMALVFVVVLGNLGVVQLVHKSFIKLGGESPPSTIPVFAKTVSAFRGLWEVIAHGAKLPLRNESWYWYPTRIIPSDTGNPIAEFPSFTFLYGDLHAHMIAFSLTLLALTLVISWVRDSRPRWSSILIGGLVIGALWPTNGWDYPTYLALGLVSLAMGMWGVKKRPSVSGSHRGWIKGFVLRAGLLIGSSLLLYQPYFQNYAAGYTSVEKWNGLHTGVNIYLWIHGILLFPIVTRMLIEVIRVGAQVQIGPKARFGLGLFAVGLLVILLVWFLLGYQVAVVTIPVGLLAAYLVLVPGMPIRRRLLWFLVGTSMALGLAVEIFVIKGDIGRQNTVFKFYLQVWTLLSTIAGVSLAWIYERARRWRPEWRQLWWTVMGVLIFGGALFLPYGIRARAADRMSPQPTLTLDGMAFMEHSTVWDGDPNRETLEIPLDGDYFAIQWMQDEIEGSPVILEGLGYREYLWSNRVSIYTGLPTVVGWRWHEVQQYAALPDYLVNWRRDDVRDCYNTLSIPHAQEILTRYGVRYIYVGGYEWAYYDPVGLAKFDQMVDQGLLRVAYDKRGVKIYEITGD